MDIFIKLLLFSLVSSTLAIQNDVNKPQEMHLEQKQETRVKQTHTIDSVNMLMFISLLILNILTIWLFKHRRLRFVHETGLAIIYGLIVGAIIRYTSKDDINQLTHVDVVMVKGSNHSPPFSESNLPDYVNLIIPKNTSSAGGKNSQRYTFDNGVQPDAGSLGQKAIFDPEIFFNVLLPPIIFNAGYSLKRKSFFRNFGAIMTFAFMGTIISTFVIGTTLYLGMMLLPIGIGFNNCLLFGAVISATDPVTVLAIFTDLRVDVDLNALVFGESVLNDAVAIVLSETIEKYESSKHGFDGMAILYSFSHFLVVFLGAGGLGCAMGCINALLTKYTHIREFPILETSLFFLMSYGTFLAAEAAQFTGIVAVLFCGICQAHYTYNNLSREAKIWTKQLFELLNFLMENFVFIYIGVSTFTFTQHEWNWGFIVIAFFAVILGRFLNVYPLSFLLNLGRSQKINYNIQHMMMFSGLRGAMAFALAIRNTSTQPRRVLFTTTLLIVETTVVLCGGCTTQMLQWLNIRVGIEDESEQSGRHFQAIQSITNTRRKKNNYNTMENDNSPSETPAHSQTDVPLGSTPGRLADKARLVKVWYNIDSRYIKPLLTNSWPPLTETCHSCCLPLARLLTTVEQMEKPLGYPREQTDSDTDLILGAQDLAYRDHNPMDVESLDKLTSTTTTANTGYNQQPISNISGLPQLNELDTVKILAPTNDITC